LKFISLDKNLRKLAQINNGTSYFQLEEKSQKALEETFENKMALG